jgi:DNA-binding NarL/FixJ family response regulator
MHSRRILLVSSDLMASSRLTGVARGLGDTLEVRASLASVAAAAPYDVVLIDVQSCPDPSATIAQGRQAAGAAGKVVAFGPHVWKERLEAAVAAGADAAATRGEVMEGLAALLDRVSPK